MLIMTLFDLKIDKRQLTHNEIALEKCHWCAITHDISLYFFDNTKTPTYGGLVWVCKACLPLNDPPPSFKIIVHKMSTQDVFTLKLILNA